MAMAARLHLPTQRSSIVATTTNDGALPPDMLYEILLRLPAKPICRFRAVCSSWLSLLCHPDFIAAARNPGPLIAIGLCADSYTNEVSVLDIESGEAMMRVKVVTNNRHNSFRSVSDISHDRLACVVDVHNRLQLLDLTNGVLSLLPDYTRPVDYTSNTTYIIGRAASTREHKLLAISTSIRLDKRQVCKILTLGSANGGWRDTPHPPFNIVWQTKGTAVVNGIVYFLSDYRGSMGLHTHKIMAFDLNSEAWRPMADSLQGPGKRQCSCLADIDGQLVAGRTKRSIASLEIELWFLLDSDTSYWSKLYTITMPNQSYYEHFIKPLAVQDGCKIVLWMRVSRVGSAIEDYVVRVYDLRTKTFVDATSVSNCRNMSVFTWNLLHSGPRGAIDMAAKLLLINRRHDQSGAPSSIEGRPRKKQRTGNMI